MPVSLFSKKLSIPALLAAGLTLLLWWLFTFVSPDFPLGVMETALVFLVLFALCHGIAWLWRRRRTAGEGEA